MCKIKLINPCKKGYKRMAKRGMDLPPLDEVTDHLRQDISLEFKYKNHILKEKFKDFHEYHIKPGRLFIYLMKDDIPTLTFINTGGHADLFGM